MASQAKYGSTRIKHLRSHDVTFHLETPVTAIDCDQRRITSVTVKQDGRETEIQADYYVDALPIEVMTETPH